VIAQSVQGLAMGWKVGVYNFDSQQRLGIFLFSTASTPALGPTQLPVHWVPGALSPGVKWLGNNRNII